jgi:hypothetical protein
MEELFYPFSLQFPNFGTGTAGSFHGIAFN